MGDDGGENVGGSAEKGVKLQDGKRPEHQNLPYLAFARDEKEEGGKQDIHLDLDGKGPHDTDDVGAV